LLRIGLSNAVVALLMALVVVSVACIWRRPAVLHALWLLVLLKLVTPPLLWVPVPWPMVAEAAPVVSLPVVEPVVEPAPDANTEILTNFQATVETPDVETSLPTGEPGRVSAPSSVRSLESTWGDYATPLACIVAVWLAGAVAWYALALVRLKRFGLLLRHAIPAPEALRQRTQRLAEKLRLRRCPGVWLVPGRVAPMLWAAGGRPRIFFPMDLLKQVGVEQQNALLVHELAHLRRRDHWVRWLEFAAAGLYWWNPVFWFARRELREAEEQCCDAWVTSTLPGAGKTYATALLETLDFLSDAPAAIPLLASGVGRVADLKRRLAMIMRGTTPKTLGWRGGAAVVGLGALLLPMLPAWVQAQAPAKAEAKTEVKVEDPPSPADLEKARAELKSLEAVLEQRKADMAEAAARVEAARARVRRDEGAAAKTADAEVPSNYDIVVKVNGDAEYVSLQDFLKQIQAVKVQGASPTLIVLDKNSGKIIMKMAGGKTEGVDSPPAGLRWTGPGELRLSPGQPPLLIAATETDKRIIDLEMKLKSLLSEVEKLRQERKPEPPKPPQGESKLHSYGPAPLEKVPYIAELFKQVGPAAELQQKAAMQEKLRADMELRKVEAAVERDSAQAKIKMLEEEIARLKNAPETKEPAKR
jgi:bla regulator protein BlaR1